MSTGSSAYPLEDSEVRLGAGLDFTSPDSPLAKYYLYASDVAAIFLLSFLFVMTSVLPLPREDVRFQLELGQKTLRNGVWSQEPAQQLSWAFHTGLYFVFLLGNWLSGSEGTAGGVDCLRSVYAILVVARLTFLWVAFRQVSRSPSLAFVGLLILLIFSIGRVPRLQPILFGEACFAALLLVLTYQMLNLRLVYLISGMFILWANVHESFLLGFVLMIVCLIATIIQSKFSISRNPLILPLTGLFLICLGLVTFLNPRGPFIMHTLWSLANNPHFLALEAWQPLTFHFGAGGHWTFVLLWCLVVLTQHAARSFFAPFPLLCLIVFGFWPLWQQQALIEWAMIAPWCILSLAPQAMAGWALPDWVPLSVPSFRKTILAGLFVIIASTWFPPIHWLIGGQPTPLERSLTQTK